MNTMRSRKRVSIFWATALLFGMTLGALPGVLLAADVRGNKKNQGKSGDRCETSADCERSPAVLRCVANGDKKECAEPPPPPMKVT